MYRSWNIKYKLDKIWASYILLYSGDWKSGTKIKEEKWSGCHITHKFPSIWNGYGNKSATEFYFRTNKWSKYDPEYEILWNKLN